LSVSESSQIPFLDLVRPHVELEDELVAAFRGALHTAGFVGGSAVEEFERDFAAFCGVRHSVGVASGTDALRFALMGSGVEAGQTVVTVPNTFIATTEAISQAGAQPEFVDVDARTGTMDPAKLRAYLERGCVRDAESGRAVSKRTGGVVSAVVPVHLYGQMADMDPILDLAAQYHFTVVEDACQAHGAEYFSRTAGRWCRAGSMGRAAAFSFYPGKNLGACGEAGAVTTNEDRVAERSRMLRDHGQSKKYFHDIEGYNGRLDAVQARILTIKLRRLAAWNLKRRDNARRYNELFEPIADSVVVPFESLHARAVYHLYVIRIQGRDRLQAQLAQAGIATQIHYPTPLHLQNAYVGLGYRRGDFPVSETLAGEILSLPMYPNLEARHVMRIVQSVGRFMARAVPVAAASTSSGTDPAPVAERL